MDSNQRVVPDLDLSAMMIRSLLEGKSLFSNEDPEDAETLRAESSVSDLLIKYLQSEEAQDDFPVFVALLKNLTSVPGGIDYDYFMRYGTITLQEIQDREKDGCSWIQYYNSYSIEEKKDLVFLVCSPCTTIAGKTIYGGLNGESFMIALNKKTLLRPERRSATESMNIQIRAVTVHEIIIDGSEYWRYSDKEWYLLVVGGKKRVLRPEYLEGLFREKLRSN